MSSFLTGHCNFFWRCCHTCARRICTRLMSLFGRDFDRTSCSFHKAEEGCPSTVLPAVVGPAAGADTLNAIPDSSSDPDSNFPGIKDWSMATATCRPRAVDPQCMMYFEETDEEIVFPAHPRNLVCRSVLHDFQPSKAHLAELAKICRTSCYACYRRR